MTLIPHSVTIFLAICVACSISLPAPVVILSKISTQQHALPLKLLTYHQRMVLNNHAFHPWVTALSHLKLSSRNYRNLMNWVCTLCSYCDDSMTCFMICGCFFSSSVRTILFLCTPIITLSLASSKSSISIEVFVSQQLIKQPH